MLYQSGLDNSYPSCKQGIAGDTDPLAQDYLVWANTELANFMSYNSYMSSIVYSGSLYYLYE